jgi:hypothetical protein
MRGYLHNQEGADCCRFFPGKRGWKTRETKIRLVSLKIIFLGKSCGQIQVQDYGNTF